MKKRMLLCGLLLAGVLAAPQIEINGIVYEVATLSRFSDDEKQALRQPVREAIGVLEQESQLALEQDNLPQAVMLLNKVAMFQLVLSKLASSDTCTVVDYGHSLGE